MVKSAKKGKGAKMMTNVSKKAVNSPDTLNSPDLSSIERASFLEAAHQNHGNPLHSTAMEEDLNLTKDDESVGRSKDALLTRRSAATKQEREEDGAKAEEVKKRGRSAGGKAKAGPGKGRRTGKKMGAITEERQESEEEESDPGPARKRNRPVTSSDEDTGSSSPRLVVRKAKQRRSVERTRTARPVKNSGPDGEKRRKTGSGSKKADDPQTQSESGEEREESDSGPAREPESANRDQQRERRPDRQGRTEQTVVLDTFLDLCDQYRESVESSAVRKAIDSFSSTVTEYLEQKITTSTELRVLKRDNAKVDSLIRKKRQKMLDAKYELIRAEQQVYSLQKEEAKLELRLADLRRGQAFLWDIKELNKQYLEHRQTHPKEMEEYGASSLPALLLETRCVLGVEDQLKKINDRLEKRLQEIGE